MKLTDDQKKLIAERILTDQLTKRLRIIEATYKAQIEELQEALNAENQKAIGYWEAIVKARMQLQEVL